MKLLITGGFGYLGGRLGQFLAHDARYEIVLGSRRHIEAPPWLLQAKVARTNWNSLGDLQKLCAGIDAVVHSAGMNAQDCAANPVAALKFNAVATARLVEAAIRQEVKQFIYISTAHVYGNPLAGVVTEATCPVSLHPYATSHRAGEDVVRAAHERRKIYGIVIRLSNAFGAPAHKSANCWMLLVNDLCRQAVTTRRMVLHSAGLQLRDFVTLHDFARAISHLLDLPKERGGDGIFNVGGAWAPRIIDMAEAIQGRCSTVLGFTPKIVRAEPVAGESTGELDYRIDKLLATGFALGGNPLEEIDATLRLCHDAYGSV